MSGEDDAEGELSFADAVVLLYGAEPAAFVAERTKLVRVLKAAKRKDDAARVAGLRKPLVVEHALNVAAREQPDVAARWAAAVAEAAEAQSSAIGGGDGDRLRAATTELRAATTALAEAAAGELDGGGDATARRGELLALIRGLSTPAGATHVVAGIVGSGTPEAEELFAGAPDPPAGRRREPRAGRAAPHDDRARSAPAGSAGSKRPARQLADQETAEEEAAQKAAQQAALERRRDELAGARSALDEAEAAVADAEAGLEEARAALKAAEATRRNARQEVTAAEKRLARAEPR